MRHRLSLTFVSFVCMAACGGGGDPGGAAVDSGAFEAASDGADASDAAGGCRRDGDCLRGGGSFETCARVEDPVCGGAPLPEECVDDASCAEAGAAFVCVRGSCGGSRCVAKCKGKSDCPATSACDTTTGRCGPQPCAGPSDCPTNFACGTDKRCAPKACTTDGECVGFCVRSYCSSAVGVCRPPAA